MQTDPPSDPIPRSHRWAGRILIVLSVLILTFSAVMKLARPGGVIQGFEHLGYSISLAVPFAILELACVVLYLIPRTSVLGAILLTGYLGGATATHVRVGDAFYVPILVGMMLWGGLYMRGFRIRNLISNRR